MMSLIYKSEHIMFNLIPHDPEAYLIAADYAEEQGKLLTNAIRKKILPLDIEKGNGEGCELSYEIFTYRTGYGGDHGTGFGSGQSDGRGGLNYGYCWGTIDHEF